MRCLLQDEFFSKVEEPQAVRHIFEHLPEVFFFVKDRQSRLMAGSNNMVQRLGLKREADLVGKGDEEFFDVHLVQAFRRDDELVFRTGKPLINRLELWYDEHRNHAWFLTTKTPLRGKGGDIVGLMGITRRDESSHNYHPAGVVAKIVDYLNKNPTQALSTADLARTFFMSERTLHRKIHESLGISPYELVIRIRIQKAAEALVKSNAKVIDVAIEHGFCDPSSFTQHFRKRIGITPSQFRKRHQSS